MSADAPVYELHREPSSSYDEKQSMDKHVKDEEVVETIVEGVPVYDVYVSPPLNDVPTKRT